MTKYLTVRASKRLPWISSTSRYDPSSIAIVSGNYSSSLGNSEELSQRFSIVVQYQILPHKGQ